MKKILIIGAGYLQSFVIKKAKEMGYETYAVDYDPKAPGFLFADKFAIINIVDEEKCLEYARENNIDGVLTAATDYGVLTAAYIAKELKLPGLDYNVAKLIKNKYEVRKCLYDNRVDDTKQCYYVDENTDLEALKDIVEYPVIVKPCDGSGSRGTSRADKPEDLNNACEMAKNGSITHRAEIETFIFGKEYGAESLVVDGEIHVLGIMQKWMTKPPYYAELGHSLPNDLSEKTEKKAVDCVTGAIKALGINHGSVNMDLIISGDGNVYIVDVGARMGGNMIGPCVIPYGTGFDYMGAMIKAAAGDEITFEKGNVSCVATKLLAFEDGIAKNIPETEAFEKLYDVELYHHIEKGQAVHEYHTNLDGLGYIVAKADTQEKAVEKAEKALEAIKKIIFD